MEVFAPLAGYSDKYEKDALTVEGQVLTGAIFANRSLSRFTSISSTFEACNFGGVRMDAACFGGGFEQSVYRDCVFDGAEGLRSHFLTPWRVFSSSTLQSSFAANDAGTLCVNMPLDHAAMAEACLETPLQHRRVDEPMSIESDIALFQARAYAAKLAETGVDATCVRSLGMLHWHARACPEFWCAGQNRQDVVNERVIRRRPNQPRRPRVMRSWS
jgi:hypothetical protein